MTSNVLSGLVPSSQRLSWYTCAEVIASNNDARETVYFASKTKND